CGVSLTGEAKHDPVLGALPEKFPIFQWHDDTFDLPEKAVRLAGNDVAANQAFRIGRAVYGFQFHFEADRPLVRDWSTSFAALIAERHPDWTGRLDYEMASNGPHADAAGLAIARAWVATI
ncbi:MAG: GMP synthase, partial [Mesorhizobium sp.]